MKIINLIEAEFQHPLKHHKVVNRVLLDKKTGGKSIQISYGYFSPGGYGEVHSHYFEQAFFVMRGELSVIVQGRKKLVKPNSLLHIPPEEEHFIRNEGRITVEVLVINGAAEYKI